MMAVGAAYRIAAGRAKMATLALMNPDSLSPISMPTHRIRSPCCAREGVQAATPPSRRQAA